MLLTSVDIDFVDFNYLHLYFSSSSMFEFEISRIQFSIIDAIWKQQAIGVLSNDARIPPFVIGEHKFQQVWYNKTWFDLFKWIIWFFSTLYLQYDRRHHLNINTKIITFFFFVFQSHYLILITLCNVNVYINKKQNKKTP